jgi:hypothetical protein
MYVKPLEKDVGMVLYMTLNGWEPGFKSLEMEIQ